MGALALGDPSGAAYPFSAGCMYPVEMFTDYIGSYVDEVAYLDLGGPETAGRLQLNVYLGGEYMPEVLVSSQYFDVTGDEYAMKTVTLDHPVYIDGTQNLWVMFFNDGTEEYAPVPFVEDLGDANTRWVCVMDNWMDLAMAGANFSFIQKVHFGANRNGVGNFEAVAVNNNGNFEANNLNVMVNNVNRPAIRTSMRDEDIVPVQYNVYRSADDVNYELIGSVPYVEGQTYYAYLDTPEVLGNYYYQVRTVYDDGCESWPALNADDNTLDYVYLGVDAVNESNGNVALFPNPTKGSVTIQAQGMNHITVVSVLGQVVYDANVAGDEYTLNMAQFNAGMYVVRVATENGVAVKRVTVMQ